MKRKAFLYPVMVLTVTIISCSKEFPNDPFQSKDLLISSCKTKGGPAKGYDPEYITLKTHDDYYILFNHINSLFNCDPGQITLTVDKEDNTITIDENELMKGVHCICPYDLSCTIGPLPYGHYSMIFKKSGMTFKEYPMDFTKSTNIRIDI